MRGAIARVARQGSLEQRRGLLGAARVERELRQPDERLDGIRRDGLRGTIRGLGRRRIAGLVREVAELLLQGRALRVHARGVLQQLQGLALLTERDKRKGAVQHPHRVGRVEAGRGAVARERLCPQPVGFVEHAELGVRARIHRGGFDLRNRALHGLAHAPRCGLRFVEATHRRSLRRDATDWVGARVRCTRDARGARRSLAAGTRDPTRNQSCENARVRSNQTS